MNKQVSLISTHIFKSVVIQKRCLFECMYYASNRIHISACFRNRLETEILEKQVFIYIHHTGRDHSNVMCVYTFHTTDIVFFFYWCREYNNYIFTDWSTVCLYCMTKQHNVQICDIFSFLIFAKRTTTKILVGVTVDRSLSWKLV